MAHLRPGGARVIDVHTHLGNDEDGMSLDPQGLIAMLDAAGADQAVVFPLHDPERDPAYRVPPVKRIEQPPDLVAVPHIAALELGQCHMTVVDVIKDGGDFHS